ncbi:MAG: LLM class flavin-dependent oxidoreductase, partial [Pseudomonadales bacterium]|nr:LLM class flavin-dependent oxidoreductase [Pseudomonadales bacterium]
MNLGKIGVWYFTDTKNSTDAAAFAKSIEELGYSALWIPETVGRNPFVHAGWLLANTESLILATGIASIYNRDPGASMAAAKTLAEQSGDRFIMGLGVSHQP